MARMVFRFAAVIVVPLWASLPSSCARGDGPAAQETPAAGAGIIPSACAIDGRRLETIDTLLASWRRAEGIPGLAAGVVCGDSLRWARGYGVRAVDDSVAVTPATLFRVASVTKVFTAMAVMTLVETGAVGLDDPVRDHLPWFELQRPAGTRWSEVTTRHLLTHTSGVPRDSKLTDFSRLYQPPREAAIAVLPDQVLQSPPGETYAYSNLGYGILGELIAAASGLTYAEHLERRVLGPLGMESTLVHPRPADVTAWGHGPLKPDGTREKAGFWELGIATPAGGMASSVEDLSHFLRLQLAPYAGRAPAILTADLIREMHRIHHMVDSSLGGSGLAWGVDVARGRNVIYHGGELPEQSSFVLIDLQAALGIVILANAQAVDVQGAAWRVWALLTGSRG